MQGTLTLVAIQEHNLIDHAEKAGEQLLGQLHGLENRFSEVVVDTRGLGLMTAIEFDTKERREDIVEAAFQRGLLTLGCGQKMLRLLPPLDVTQRELDIAITLLEEAIAETT